MSFKPVVQTDSSGKWYSNSLRFATHAEALTSAKDLMSRWMLVTACDVQESDDPVNYAIVNSVLFPVMVLVEVPAAQVSVYVQAERNDAAAGEIK